MIKNIFYLLIICLWSISAFGQPLNAGGDFSDLYFKLSQKGYQSVLIQKNDNQLNVYYENRVQRFEPRAIIEIVRTIESENVPKGIDIINVITQKLQVPLISTTFALSDFKDWQLGKMTLADFVNSIVITQTEKKSKLKDGESFANNGNYRLELELRPEIGLGLGGFPDPVIHRIFLVPTLNAYLWKGALLKSEVILPISSEFDILGERFVRPGILSLSQTIKLPRQLWLQGAVGYFSKNRYGGNLSAAKFLFNGNLSITGQIGYTGYAAYPKKLGLDKAEKGWEYADVDYVDYRIGARYWFKEWNTSVQIEYGRALFEKSITKLTVLQRFNEVDIGFFAQKTQRGENYGMQLKLPISPKRYWKPKRLSIRPSRTLNYTYQATQATVETYQSGETILGLHRHLNPSFIKRQLLQLQRWSFN